MVYDLAPLKPGARIGILGGGQLGRMLALAGARMGVRCHIYEPAQNPCAGHVCDQVTQAGYDDDAALAAFAKSVDVVTFEFENVDLHAVDVIAQHVPVHPPRRALEVAQDRIAEKDFLNGIGLATAPYHEVGSRDDLETAFEALGGPAILKTRRLGYDGKGQARVSTPADLDAAWERMAGAPSVLEGFVAFEKEISVIAARGQDGAVVCFDPGENEHRDGILYETTVPAEILRSTAQDAVLIAGRILTALDYVGVIGVELFVVDGQLIVNEIAPRVHNSGHWTQDACMIDQFEMHMRAVSGWPLGDGMRHSNARMQNLLGSEIDGADHMANAAVHVYDKGEARPGRKMGHVTWLSERRS